MKVFIFHYHTSEWLYPLTKTYFASTPASDFARSPFWRPSTYLGDDHLNSELQIELLLMYLNGHPRPSPWMYLWQWDASSSKCSGLWHLHTWKALHQATVPLSSFLQVALIQVVSMVKWDQLDYTVHMVNSPEKLRDRLGLTHIRDYVQRRRLRWFRHVERDGRCELVKK